MSKQNRSTKMTRAKELLGLLDEKAYPKAKRELSDAENLGEAAGDNLFNKAGEIFTQIGEEILDGSIINPKAYGSNIGQHAVSDVFYAWSQLVDAVEKDKEYEIIKEFLRGMIEGINKSIR